MQTLTVVIASAGGLALGYATAAHFAARAKDLLLEQFQEEKAEAVENADLTIRELREELAEQSEPDASESVSQSKSKGRSGAKNKHKNKKKHKGGTETNEIVKLKEIQAEQAKLHSGELSELKQANLDALDMLKSEHGAALKSLEEAAEHAAAAHAESLAESLARVVESNEAPVADLGTTAPAGNAEFATALESAGMDLTPILQTLINHEGQQTAVLVDASGIVVAVAGDIDTADNVSASANILTGIPKQLDGMLPLESHYTFRLQDQNNAVVGRTFELSGDTYALVTVGNGAPADDSIGLTINSLHQALE